MENGIEWKENFGMEYGRCSEWNGSFEKWNGRSSSILPDLPNSELHILQLVINHELNVMRLPISKKLQQGYLCKLQYLA